LQWTAGRLAAMVGTPRSELLNHEPESCPGQNGSCKPFTANGELWATGDPRWAWVETVVPIRFSRGDVRHVLLGRRLGGRPYLSEDLRILNVLAGVVVDEVERFRSAELQRLVSEAELRALQAQINPHFLFNALNTIYGIIPREARGARRTVLNLAEIFRYFLQSDKILIPLTEELKIVRAYLEIERLRLGPRLQTVIKVDRNAEDALIPILSVQPLVENAIKHGVSAQSGEGWLRLTAALDGNCLNISVEDSGADAGQSSVSNGSKGAGVGLANVTRRLQLCFGPDAGVQMQKGALGTKVQFSVPLSEAGTTTTAKRTV